MKKTSNQNNLPSVVDLTPYCPPIGDSKGISSTVGWATGYQALTIQYAIKKGWNDKNQIRENAFSPMFIFNQTKISDCSGGSFVDSAFHLLKTKGVCLMKSFDTEDCFEQPSNKAFEEALNFRIQDFNFRFHPNISPNITPYQKVQITKQVLAQNQPMVIGLSIKDNFLRVASGQKTWIPYPDDKIVGTSTLTVVGYDDKKGAFRLMNHWGPQWGDYGFIWIMYSDFRQVATHGYSIELGEDFGQNTTISSSIELPTTDFPIPETVLVQGDTFTMGCTKEQEPYCNDDEKPAHKVQVSTFRMGKYEVTNEQFAAFLNEKGNREEEGYEWVDLEGDYNGVVCGIEEIKGQFQAKKGLEKHPMIYVSWYGARAYAQWLSEKTGQNWRLPTEAEWEFAARGGQKRQYHIYAGSNDIEAVAWYRENSYDKGEKHPDYGTHPVGQKAPNELGIYDMSGNVWEWVEDCWHDNYQNAPEQANPWVERDKGDCTVRVLRGGSWNSFASSTRVSGRTYVVVLSYGNFSNGFRLVQD